MNWVELDDILELHQVALEMGGGHRSPPKINELESALARPKNAFAFGESDIFVLASLYTEGIIRNHPFGDANKRSSWLCAVFFCELNGIEISESLKTVELVTGLAARDKNRKDIEKHLRSLS